jgi:uncharacterized RDD family membrane protein YckC
MMENSSQLESTPQTDLLSDVAESISQYQYATQGQRFINWLIDNLLMRFGLSYLTGTVVALILRTVAPDFLYSMVDTENGSPRLGLYVLGYMIAILNYLIYYTLCEKLFKGYTLGKIITGTRAIRQDGKELTFKDAFIRSAIRLIPFEVFSGFNTLTWHDNWTDTMVIKAR